jgi:hypothetical protein
VLHMSLAADRISLLQRTNVSLVIQRPPYHFSKPLQKTLTAWVENISPLTVLRQCRLIATDALTHTLALASH